jgi:diketogulonate reductase-like aldo/keto reductase
LRGDLSKATDMPNIASILGHSPTTLPHSRRDFITYAIQGAVVAAATTLSSIPAGAQTKAQTPMPATTSEHYKPPVRFGLGGVPLGNEFAVITEKDAYATLEAAWSAGVRYYDTSPWYGLGLCERRFGNFLHTKNRSDYVLSSKVGKLLKASRQNSAKEYFPFTPSPNNLVFDYTADGVKRSIDDSLQRLGVDALDIVFVHDLSPDNLLLPSPWEEQFEIARKGAFPALTRMREEGIIKGWGLGVNRPEPIMKLLDVADADVCLLASQYSLIDHQNALHHVFPPRVPRAFRSWWVRRSTPASSAAASDTITARTTTRSRRRSSRSAKSCARSRDGTASICGPRRCNSPQRRMSPRPWLSAPAANSRLSLTIAPCRSRFRPSSGRS